MPKKMAVRDDKSVAGRITTASEPFSSLLRYCRYVRSTECVRSHSCYDQDTGVVVVTTLCAGRRRFVASWLLSVNRTCRLAFHKQTSPATTSGGHERRWVDDDEKMIVTRAQPDFLRDVWRVVMSWPQRPSSEQFRQIVPQSPRHSSWGRR